MGLFKPCYSVNPLIGSTEVAVFELYDEVESRNVGPANPGFDDVLGEPFLEDTNDDGIGERVRPVTVVNVNVKVKFTRKDEQQQDGTGNAPGSLMTLTVSEEHLRSLGLLTNGKPGIRANDRLLRLQSSSGVVRVDFEAGGLTGPFVFEVRPGETGSGVFMILLENRRIVGS